MGKKQKGAELMPSPHRLIPRRLFVGLCWAALAWTGNLPADELELINGKIYKGSFIQQDDSNVTFKVQMDSGIEATISTPIKTIAAIRKSSGASIIVPGTVAAATSPAPAVAPPVSAPAPDFPAASPAKPKGPYNDGTCTGSARGFKSTIKVSVTVVNSKITNVQVVSQADTANYFNRAKAVIQQVISKNGTNGVNTVSGATFSSRGILKAVQSALDTVKTSP